MEFNSQSIAEEIAQTYEGIRIVTDDGSVVNILPTIRMSPQARQLLSRAGRDMDRMAKTPLVDDGTGLMVEDKDWEPDLMAVDAAQRDCLCLMADDPAKLREFLDAAGPATTLFLIKKMNQVNQGEPEA